MTASKIGERTYIIDTNALGNPGTVAVYVVKGGKKTALIDAGYASCYQTVLLGLKEIGVQPSDVDYLIPTHVHLDHAGGAGHILEHMPRAKVIAQERATPHLIDPSRLIQSATSIYGEERVRLLGLPIPIGKERIESVGEELHIDLGGASLTAVHTPGHAPHQISVLLEEERLLFSADAVGTVYPTVSVLIPATPAPSFDPAKLVDSVGMLGQMTPSKLLVPHYGARTDVGDVFEATKSKTEEWVSNVKEMKRQGLTQQEINRRQCRAVAEESGLDALPDYAQLSIAVSVMGILSFLERSP